MYSCKNESSQNHKESINADTLLTGMDTTSNAMLIGFDVLKFKHLADSLLSFLQHKEMAFNLTIDTLQVADLSNVELENHPTGFLVKTSNDCIKYHFDLESPNRNLRFDIIQSIFNSTESTDSAFIQMKYMANEDLVSESGVPGLTYTNDFVIKQSLNIYWINTGCIYSFENHKKYSEFLLNSLSDKTVIDSIWCKCGAVNCKN
ncbi:MAG: hypothetical protein A3F72_01655 [Bacteroidetes bacterium RIFCSPLOWO2_12_FULL_35_15]|nr:MAG: hypothetical protein A3F72_01655 [Bacteroidetes bacterium RIFCSPLOWO2_12_FULL_35_15]